jgi:hypothetical protein
MFNPTGQDGFYEHCHLHLQAHFFRRGRPAEPCDMPVVRDYLGRNPWLFLVAVNGLPPGRT